jgi:hypothetical protein
MRWLARLGFHAAVIAGRGQQSKRIGPDGNRTGAVAPGGDRVGSGLPCGVRRIRHHGAISWQAVKSWKSPATRSPTPGFGGCPIVFDIT